MSGFADVLWPSVVQNYTTMQERAQSISDMAVSLATCRPSLHAFVCLQIIRDAEMLTASEVALLPITVLQLYKQRSPKEQQAVATHAFFDSLIKPWALEPSKLSTQVGFIAFLCTDLR